MNLLNQNLFRIVTLSFLSFGCEYIDTSKPQEDRGSGSADDLSNITEVTTTTKSDIHTNDVDVDLLDKGLRLNYHAFILEAEGLKQQYSKVFGTNLPRGYAIDFADSANFGNKPPLDPTEIFTSQEKRILGTFNLRVTPEITDDSMGQQAKWLDNISQDYIKVVRSFLAEACDVRIRKDQVNLAENRNLDTNVIIKSYATPTTQNVSAFMTLMFGYAPPDGQVHIGAKEYAKIATEGINKTLQAGDYLPGSIGYSLTFYNEYFLLCIAIGQDHRVFIR